MSHNGSFWLISFVSHIPRDKHIGFVFPVLHLTLDKLSKYIYLCYFNGISGFILLTILNKCDGSASSNKFTRSTFLGVLDEFFRDVYYIPPFE